MLVYEGIFFDKDTSDIIRLIEKEKLEKKVKNLHCTFKFHPKDDEIFDELVGKEIEIALVGYGCDGNNSGFQVELPEYIKDYYINYEEDNPESLKVPHITTSLAEGAKAVDTKNLDFEPLPKKCIIKGRFGYFIAGRSNSFVSYEPQLEKSKVRKRL